MTLGRVKRGPDWQLENHATALLMKDRKDRGLSGDSSKLMAEEYSWLNDWQLDGRLEHEVYTSIGTPDPSVHLGVFWRAYNPLSGTRPRRRTEAV